MCDKHTHAKVETWITPESSRHLSAKMIGLFPGESMPAHTTGPGREEVIICIYGKIEVSRQTDATPAGGETWSTLFSGEACFIPENCVHEVANTSDAPAQYAYVVTKKQKICPVCDGSGKIIRSTKNPKHPLQAIVCPHCGTIGKAAYAL